MMVEYDLDAPPTPPPTPQPQRQSVYGVRKTSLPPVVDTVELHSEASDGMEDLTFGAPDLPKEVGEASRWWIYASLGLVSLAALVILFVKRHLLPSISIVRKG